VVVGGMVVVGFVVGFGDGRMGWFCVDVQFVRSCECSIYSDSDASKYLRLSYVLYFSTRG
jgi:hypothetical protein